MIFTTENPLTNPERYAIWRARKRRHEINANKVQPMFLRELMGAIAALICMGLTVLAVVLIAEWVVL